jgi:hypothetical protein
METTVTRFDFSSSDTVSFPEDLRSKVSAIQLKYITMLQRYVREAYPRQANTKFAGGLLLIQESI